MNSSAGNLISRRRRRIAIGAVGAAGVTALALLPLTSHADEDAPAFSADYVSTTLGGGEPFVIYSHGTGNLVYSGHEGTTHIDRTYAATPGSSCDLKTQTGFLCSYDNQVNIWYSSDQGKTWTRSPGNPQYTGFSDPSLTEDAGNNIYDTGIDLANDAVYASPDGGKTWAAGTAQCHEGDRPWLAGGKANQVFMSTDTEESGHEIFQGTLAGGSITCSNGIADNGTTASGESYSGQGQIYYDHQTGDLVEGVGFGDGGFGVGVLPNASNADFSGGTSHFVDHEGIDCKRYAQLCSQLGPLAPEIAIDRNNTIYVVWATDPRSATDTTDGCGNLPNTNGGNALLQNQVVMISTPDEGRTWSAPKVVANPSRIAGDSPSDPFNGHTVLWPWITAGAPGNVSVVWYEANQLTDPDCDSANLGGHEPTQWTVQVANIFNANSARTHYPAESVSAVPNFDGNHPGGVIHHGGICESGTTCAATGQDRRLGDYFTNALDQNGCVMIATADTQIVDSSTGTASTSSEYDTGRPLFVHQVTGPSLTTGRPCGPGEPDTAARSTTSRASSGAAAAAAPDASAARGAPAAAAAATGGAATASIGARNAAASASGGAWGLGLAGGAIAITLGLVARRRRRPPV